MKLCAVPFILFPLLVEVYCGNHDLRFNCSGGTVINCNKVFLVRSVTTSESSSSSGPGGSIVLYPHLCQKGKDASNYDNMQTFIDEVKGSVVLIHAGSKRRTGKKWLRAKAPTIYKDPLGKMLATVCYVGLFEPTDDTKTPGLDQGTSTGWSRRTGEVNE